MEKIANYLILGVTDDIFGDELVKIAADYEMPDWVRDAKILDEDELDMLSPDDFALVVTGKEGTKRYFPTVDNAHVYLSVLYFIGKAKSLPQRAREIACLMLEQAMDDLGVDLNAIDGNVAEKFREVRKSVEATRTSPVETNIYNTYDLTTGKNPSKLDKEHGQKAPEKVKGLKTVLKKVGNMVKESRVQNWGIVQPDGTKHYPLDTVDQVETAVNHFAKFASTHLDPIYQLMYADNILKRAEMLGVDINHSSLLRWKQAALDANELSDQFSLRFGKLGSGPLKEAYRSLLSKCASFPPLKIVSMLMGLDKHAGMQKLWKDKNPLDIITKFCPPEPALQFQKTAGAEMEEVPERLIQKLAEDPAVLQKYFGPAITRQFMEDPVAVFNSLPYPEKRAVARMARGELT